MVQLRQAVTVADRGIEAAENRIQRGLEVLQFLDGNIDIEENVENFEYVISQSGRFFVVDINYGYLGKLLEGNLGPVVQDNALTNEVLQLPYSIKRSYALISEKEEIQELFEEANRQHKGCQQECLVRRCRRGR